MKEVLESKLQQLSEDSLMLQAIEFIFNERIEKEKPIIEETDNNLRLGEKYRAYLFAKGLLMEVLQDIETYKNKKVDSEIRNKGK